MRRRTVSAQHPAASVPSTLRLRFGTLQRECRSTLVRQFRSTLHQQSPAPCAVGARHTAASAPTRYATLMLGSLMAAMAALMPADANAQSAKAAFQDNYAEVNGVRLHYASIGQGPLVLFLHGYPSFWYQWKDQMAEMGRDHLAIGLDMRGYNLSSKPEGLEPYKMKPLVEDVRQFAEKIVGKDRKFILVGHDWGANVAWAFAMYHPEMLDKLIIVNGAHPMLSERELRENPAQRYASNYFFVFNNYLAPGEQPVDESNTRETAERRAHTGFVDAEVKSGRYTEADRQAWIDAWSQPGSTTAGLNYYRANHRNPPFNDRHPASTIAHSWSAKEVTDGAKSTIIKTPTLVIWGLKDTAILPGHLSGLDKWVPNLSVKLYPDDDHWVMLEKHTQVALDIRRFIDGKDFPKESVYR